jgi:hypothetical protein
MPRLYKRAQAFVLPSRGEGWGRPHLEALAMGVPVIATNWSGPTAFLTQHNGYPLSVAPQLVPVPDGPFRGHLWADPSEQHLRQLQRRVFEGWRQCLRQQQQQPPPQQQRQQESVGSNAVADSNGDDLCAELRGKSQRGRHDVLRYWTHEALTATIMERLVAIDALLLDRRTGSGSGSGGELGGGGGGNKGDVASRRSEL